MTAIEVKHVTKEFNLGQLNSLKDNFSGLMAKLRGKAVPQRKVFRALDDIDFKIDVGEVVGIIGHNGAGKSTLLKILSNVIQPTSGIVKVNGKVAPLIEIGAGLHPELTGRENVFLNGSILGMSANYIRQKIDEIVNFAELEEFIDTPIKRYSTGMKIRLGFAIATSVDADILIVDEVLAVGDLAFQRKCFDRMENIIKHTGKTVLFVSHNIRQIARMCTRVMLLDQGVVLVDGDPTEVCTNFYQRSNEKIYIDASQESTIQKKIKSSGEVGINRIDLLDMDGAVIEKIHTGDPLRILVNFSFFQPVKKPEILIGTHTTDFVYLTANSTGIFNDRPDFEPGEYEIECSIPSYPMIPGVYCIRIALFDQNRRTIFAGETLKMFSVQPTSSEIRQGPLRLMDIEAEWKIQDIIFSNDLLFDKLHSMCEACKK